MLRDPAAPSLMFFAAVVIGGFAAIYAGWVVAARTLTVAFQIPALVSGGMVGLALVAVGAGLASVQIGRRLAAAERVATEALLDEAHALVEAFRAKSS